MRLESGVNAVVAYHYRKKTKTHQPEGDKKWNCPKHIGTNDFFIFPQPS